MDQLKKRLIEKAMCAELDNHLGYTKHEKKGINSGNYRNGISQKTLRSDTGKKELSMPRYRSHCFGGASQFKKELSGASF